MTKPYLSACAFACCAIISPALGAEDWDAPHQGNPIVPGYFEGPFMVKHAGKYYLMYSSGKCTDATYQVRYAIGTDPRGPFTEASNNPILASDENRHVVGPGHHTVLQYEGQPYILEYAWKPYRFILEASQEGKEWQAVADYRGNPAMGSPVLVTQPVTARFCSGCNRRNRREPRVPHKDDPCP